MANEALKYCATDKEIYDLLMSSKQRINESALHSLAKARGIFYSPKDSRDALASHLSLLPHDYDALRELLGQSENPNRVEKVTSLTLDAKLTVADIKAVTDAFRGSREQVTSEESVTAHPESSDKYVVQVQYSEFDYAKTRLLQRRQREADIRFIVESDKTTIRMPANAKAREIVEQLKAELNSQKKTDIPSKLIEISDLSTDERTLFFTSLISTLPGYTLRDVTNVKVRSGLETTMAEEIDQEEEEEEEEDDEMAEAAEGMLSVVTDVALNGQGLLSSTEYQLLRDKGFYIAAITWISQQTTTPYNKIEFDAGFEEPKEGTGFRYNVRGLYRNKDGKFTKTLRPLKIDHKQEIFPILEGTAHQVLADLRKNGQDTKPQQTQGDLN